MALVRTFLSADVILKMVATEDEHDLMSKCYALFNVYALSIATGTDDWAIVSAISYPHVVGHSCRYYLNVGSLRMYTEFMHLMNVNILLYNYKMKRVLMCDNLQRNVKAIRKLK